MTLLKRLQDTRAWLVETKGAKHVSPKLTLVELDRVIGALQQIESRIQDPMLPPGTRRTPEKIRELLAQTYDENKMHQSIRKHLSNCA